MTIWLWLCYDVAMVLLWFVFDCDTNLIGFDYDFNKKCIMMFDIIWLAIYDFIRIMLGCCCAVNMLVIHYLIV